MKKLSIFVLPPLAGALCVYGWAPFEWWPLSLLGFAALFLLLVAAKTPLSAAFLGFSFGLGMHLTGHGWVLNTLNTKAGLPLIYAAFCTFIFAAYLALYIAVPCMVWHMTTSGKQSRHARIEATSHKIWGWGKTIGMGVIFSSLLTIGEWARSLFFNGFSSLSLGYSLIDTWLAGYAPVLGLYGVSWLGYFIAALGASALVFFKNWRMTGVLSMCLFGAGFVLVQVEWARPIGAPLTYRLVQSNIPQERKFDPSYASRHLDQLLNSITRQPADLIITPEIAFTAYINELPGETLSRLRRFSSRTGSHLFLGVATSSTNGAAYNSLVHIAPEQESLTRYDKVRLMPFGEYSPLGFRWFTDSLHIPLKDLNVGAEIQAPFVVGTHRIGTLICSEDLVGRDALRWLPEAGVLLNPSNLAWFEGSRAIAQLFQNTRMRALEAGRPILRVTNTGITAHISPKGAVLDELLDEREGTLVGTVQPMRGRTPYAIWGDRLIIVVCLVALLLFVMRRTLRKRATAS
jgi:apolipoprotein N-acyltransferase